MYRLLLVLPFCAATLSAGPTLSTSCQRAQSQFARLIDDVSLLPMTLADDDSGARENLIVCQQDLLQLQKDIAEEALTAAPRRKWLGGNAPGTGSTKENKRINIGPFKCEVHHLGLNESRHKRPQTN